MAPTTAADRMLVTSSITSSLDWMLIRDSRDGADFGVSAPVLWGLTLRARSLSSLNPED